MKALLAKLELKEVNAGACTGPDGWIVDPQGSSKLVSYDPTLNEPIASVVQAAENAYGMVVDKAAKTFLT